MSGGSAKVLTLSGKDTDTEGVDAVFTFKGTGFDLISRTDTESCTVGIRVKNEKGEVVKKPFVNAVYQSGCLYQIPLIRVSDLEYGTYTVEINVMNIQDTKGTFYLDGIRIYNPLGTNEKDGGEDFTVADKKYNEDKEANAVITEVRNLILSASEIPGKTRRIQRQRLMEPYLWMLKERRRKFLTTYLKVPTMSFIWRLVRALRLR